MKRTIFTVTLLGALCIATPQPTHAEPHGTAVQSSEPIYTFTVANPGELAQTIIEQQVGWTDILSIKVIGALNSTDLGVIKRMTNLVTLDLSEATFKALPADFVRNKLPHLETVKLPALDEIGPRAFAYCPSLNTVEIAAVKIIQVSAFEESGLKTIALPDGLTEIQYNAFAKTHLTAITIPEGIKEITPSTFADCLELTQVTLPSTLETIGYEAFARTALTRIELPCVLTIGESAFADCQQLTEVIFYVYLQELQSKAFSNCTSLTTITLPPLLSRISDAFIDCTQMKTINCYAVTPPIATANLMGEADMTDIKLYVPEVAISAYRGSENWSSFYSIYPLSGPVNNVFINDQMTIEQADPFATNTILMVGWRNPINKSYTGTLGALTYNNSSPLELAFYAQSHSLPYLRGNDAIQDLTDQRHTTLVSNGPIVAEEVVTWLNVENENQWQFISFPYDVKVADIVNDTKSVYVIRKYNSNNRAYQTGSAWENLTESDQLNAYEGYILSSLNPNTEYHFPAVKNNNKNNLFAPGNIIVQLKTYASAKPQHRSWNFIGNPYPCYFRIDQTSYTAPITVYVPAKSRYEAYSPVDDPYVLAPNQAFFVQKPDNVTMISFHNTGRMNKEQALAYLEQQSLRSVTSTTRQLFNLWLTQGDTSDKTRFVINEQASKSYELDKDASKFIDTDNQVPLLYTLEDDIRYAINERPLSDGQIRLGFYAPSAGTYTLSLDTNSEASVWITDNSTNKTERFDNSYSFQAEPGYNDSRFTVTLRDAVSTEAIEAETHPVEIGPGQVRLNESYTLYTSTGQYIGHYAAGETAYVKPGTYLVVSSHVKQIIVIQS